MGETEVREASEGLPYGWKLGDENKNDPKVSGLGSFCQHWKDRECV